MSIIKKEILKFFLCMLVLSVLLSACVTSTPSSQTVFSLPRDDDSLDVDRPDPPNLELDAALFEQLLISNFAAYSADWGQAADSALLAAKSSQDYRLARLAAMLAMRQLDFDKAVEAGQLWTKLDADNINADNTLLIAMLAAGQIQAALDKLTKSRDGKSIDEHVREVAGILVRQPNQEAALDISRHYVGEHPDSAQVLLSSAYVAQNFKQTELAQEWLAQVLQLRPNWELAAQMQVNLLRQHGKDGDRKTFVTEYLAQNPKSILMRINHAADLASAKQYQPALDIMQQVLQDDPENSSALTYTAALARQLEQDELAKKYYQRILKLEPANDDVIWALARYAIEEENYQKAERLYESVESADNYFRAQLQVANMQFHTRGLDSSIDSLRELEPKTEGEYVDVAITRHYLLMQAHEYLEAFNYINEALVYLPNNSDLVYARALVAAELNKVDVAEQDFRSIIAEKPEDANALNALGYTLADQTDRYVEAKQLILKALDLRPTDAHILDSMGWVLYKMQEYEQAIEFLQKAHAASPQAEVAAHLGEVFWEAGEPDKANKIWSEAYKNDNDNPILSKTLERYGQLEMLKKSAQSR